MEKFLVDVMLGRLAKWLRLVGYDAAYSSDADDHRLARWARAEDRILLTRDVELARRRGVRVMLIESEKVEQQLRQVFRTLELTVQEPFSRCAECNVLLEEHSPERASSRVPPYVFRTQVQFRTCPHCGRVYWRGTHWARILAMIEDLAEG